MLLLTALLSLRPSKCADRSITIIMKTLIHIIISQFLDPAVLKQSIPTVSSLRHRNVSWKNVEGRHDNNLSLTLMWDYPMKTDVENLAYCDVYVAIGNCHSYVFVGRAFVDSYRVCSLEVPSNVHCVRFIVQAVTLSRRKANLSESTSISFSWE